MITLCFDLGTQCGWAVATDTKVVASGHFNGALKPTEGQGIRYLKFMAEVKRLIGAYMPDRVVYEEIMGHVAGQTPAVGHVYGGLFAVLSMVCEDRRIPYDGVEPNTVKLAITGKGNAWKEQVVAVVRGLGHDPKSDDEADAIALALFVIHCRGVLPVREKKARKAKSLPGAEKPGRGRRAKGKV